MHGKMTPQYILGISCFFHDSAACMVKDGSVIAAAQEERFTRRKHDAGFPVHAINYCLEEAGIENSDIQLICYYENPYLALERLLVSNLAQIGIGDIGRLDNMISQWGGFRLNLHQRMVQALSGFQGKLLCAEHHLSHAASAFFPSPFDEAAILTVDGVGEWATAGLFYGQGKDIKPLKAMKYPHSLGLFYSAFTYFTGFKVNSGEYKFMGLAPYGEPRYYDLLKDNVIEICDDGSLFLNLEYFDYLTGDRMTSGKMEKLLGGKPRQRETRITQRDMDIAASVQKITEEVLLKMAGHASHLTGSRNLCLAGGVMLNCVANGKILKSGRFSDIWIQPASGDAGGALGAALAAWHVYLGNMRKATPGDSMRGALLGVDYKTQEILDFLEIYGFPYETLPDSELPGKVVELLLDGKIIGLFQGRMEYGPRALGNRSIIADPRDPGMQSRLNLRIKYRESFRPFAPIVLREKMDEWFDIDYDSKYMLLVGAVKKEKCKAVEKIAGEDLIEKVNQVRSDIPAVTHVDYSARIQTVHQETHPLLHEILLEFYSKTGVPVLINTSFNVRGEPIVCSPMDAYRCMMRTQMDCILMNNVLVYRHEQPEWVESTKWEDEFELD